jgi:hypothetical protein
LKVRVPNAWKGKSGYAAATGEVDDDPQEHEIAQFAKEDL